MSTIQRFKYLLLDGLHRFHYVFLWLERILHGLAVSTDLSFMVIVWLSFNLLVRGSFSAVVGKLLDAFSNANVVFLIFKYFVHEIAYSWCKSIIVVFTVTVDDDAAMLYGRFVTVKWDFFNILFDVLNVVPRIELKKLN